MDKILHCVSCKRDLDTNDTFDCKVVLQITKTYWFCVRCDKMLKSFDERTGLTTYY